MTAKNTVVPVTWKKSLFVSRTPTNLLSPSLEFSNQFLGLLPAQDHPSQAVPQGPAGLAVVPDLTVLEGPLTQADLVHQGGPQEDHPEIDLETEDHQDALPDPLDVLQDVMTVIEDPVPDLHVGQDLQEIGKSPQAPPLPFILSTLPI